MSNRNNTHYTVHRAESTVPAVRRSVSSNIFWIAIEGSEMGATMHFDNLPSLVAWTQALTASAIAMMHELATEGKEEVA